MDRFGGVIDVRGMNAAVQGLPKGLKCQLSGETLAKFLDIF
jgi:hypothetical protein